MMCDSEDLQCYTACVGSKRKVWPQSQTLGIIKDIESAVEDDEATASGRKR